MRREATPAEQKLWFALKARGLNGAKFRRQVVIGPYIADFACRTPLQLVVEVDGDTHATSLAYDEERTRYLQLKAYRVVRFTNADIMKNLEGVLQAIEEVLTPPLPGPLP
ncbi:endonuclease domain-containing protein [Sphingosinicella sp. BN140058]|uniref:endonuclease domain-containing protein n=1 Tax=Sphingosinicella sp. BN140058 TaxID=1892855 RepID=UPI0010105B00|nr:endonuclease domain-containing protein [Sphingosinicella sp. BN140058]QAY76250.1 endonuclease domain-containing protein [Sphingosinicella sp. BN140058]